VLARRSHSEEKVVDPEDVLDVLAKAMYEGDVVNFRLLFAPFSPARKNSTESFDMPKYAYLLPDDAMRQEHGFVECRALVKQPQTLSEIERELDANRPAQLPWELLATLGDYAVRKGKYSSAAQAYELLRIRARMQQEFLNQADAALDAGDVLKAVRGYLVATGLAYDYAAFPEPLPATPDFQTRALMLHGEYPQTPEDCIGMRDTKSLLQTALAYLLLDPEAATRLDTRPTEVRLAFLKGLVYQRDPYWEVFLERYREASEAAREFGERLQLQREVSALAEEIEKQLGEDPRRITALLLGRTLDGGEWWQYLKELAYEHPAAALFVARQALGDLEILVPRHAPDSPVAKILGL